MYQVYGSRKTRAFRVIWMLEELDQPYEFFDAPPRSDAVVALNPAGKVPVLVDDGTALTDSSAIITYLADKHQALTCAPGTTDRALQDALMHRALDEMDALLWTAARHSFVLPEERRVPEIKDSLRWEFGNSVARLSDGLKGPFLMGDQFTIADIVTLHCLTWAMGANFPVEPQNVRDYVERLQARPAYLRAKAG